MARALACVVAPPELDDGAARARSRPGPVDVLAAPRSRRHARPGLPSDERLELRERRARRAAGRLKAYFALLSAAGALVPRFMSSRPSGVHFMTRWASKSTVQNISIRAYTQAVWLLTKKFWPCAQELAGLVELHHRMGPVAKDPYVVVLVDVHSGDFAKVPTRRKLGQPSTTR